MPGGRGWHYRRPVPITVFLLDDHEIVRRGIGQLLESEDDIRVVGEAGTAAQASSNRSPGVDLVGAVRTVAAGGSLLDPRATGLVLERLRRGDEPEDPRYASLSPQERRILTLIADGLTNRQIGAQLFLAEKTVKNYVSSLLHKLGFARRTEAAVYAAGRKRPGRGTT